MPFPISPADGAEYTDPDSNKIYVYNSANSLWKIRERVRVEDFSSVSSTVTTASAGESLSCVNPGEYSELSGVSNDFQPFVINTNVYFGAGSRTYGAPGSLHGYGSSSTANPSWVNFFTTNPDKSLPAALAYSSKPVFGQMINTGINNTSGGSVISQNNALAFSILYTGPYANLGNLVTYTFNSGVALRLLVFAGQSIDLTGYSTYTEARSHPDVLVSTNATTGSGGVASHAMVQGSVHYNNVLHPGKVYTFVYYSESSNFSVKRFSSSNLATPLGYVTMDRPSSITNFAPISGTITYNTDPTLPYHFYGNGNQDTRVAPSFYDTVSIVPAADWVEGNGPASSQHNFKVVNGLPAEPWTGYPDGYSVFNSVDNKVYRWDSGSSSWQAF